MYNFQRILLTCALVHVSCCQSKQSCASQYVYPCVCLLAKVAFAGLKPVAVMHGPLFTGVCHPALCVLCITAFTKVSAYFLCSTYGSQLLHMIAIVFLSPIEQYNTVYQALQLR